MLAELEKQLVDLKIITGIWLQSSFSKGAKVDGHVKSNSKIQHQGKRWAEERIAVARSKDALNSCYSLSGVLEEQTEQSVLFFVPCESMFSDGLQDTQATLRLKHWLGISSNQPR